MAIIYSLSPGLMITMEANTVYALPPRIVHILATNTMEESVDGVAWTPLTGVNTSGVTTAASFVRASAITNVICNYN